MKRLVGVLVVVAVAANAQTATENHWHCYNSGFLFSESPCLPSLAQCKAARAAEEGAIGAKSSLRYSLSECRSAARVSCIALPSGRKVEYIHALIWGADATSVCFTHATTCQAHAKKKHIDGWCGDVTGVVDPAEQPPPPPPVAPPPPPRDTGIFEARVAPTSDMSWPANSGTYAFAKVKGGITIRNHLAVPVVSFSALVVVGMSPITRPPLAFERAPSDTVTITPARPVPAGAEADATYAATIQFDGAGMKVSEIIRLYKYFRVFVKEATLQAGPIRLRPAAAASSSGVTIELAGPTQLTSRVTCTANQEAEQRLQGELRMTVRNDTNAPIARLRLSANGEQVKVRYRDPLLKLEPPLRPHETRTVKLTVDHTAKVKPETYLKNGDALPLEASRVE